MSRRIAHLFLVVLLSMVPVPGACADEPLLTIVFTGNTLGVYGPCESCNDLGRGGLGRRSTMLRGLLEGAPTRDDVLILAGGHEFHPFKVRQAPPKGLGSALSKAFGMLPYDLGYVTRRELAWLEDDGARPPQGWLTAGDEPLSRVLRKGGMRVGVVVFPDLAEPLGQPDARAVDLAVQTCREMRPRVDLVVAMCPWNERSERSFLDAYPGVADILLGSGPGLAAGLKVEAQGRTLWLRAYYDGQIVPVLRVLGRAPGGDGWLWTQGGSYAFEPVPLDPEVKTDAAVNNLFAWF